MKVLLLGMFFMTGCAAMAPGLMQALDDAVTESAVGIQVDKSALQKDTDIKISVEIINKDDNAK